MVIKKISGALLEDAEKRYMSKEESSLKTALIALLKDDGRGHKHGLFAKRLKEFDIQIVPRKDDPDFTAACYFDKGIIQIGEGFLNNPSTFNQLSVLVRHELLHFLLQHQLRMENMLRKKYGDAFVKKAEASGSIHNLLNVIDDLEISNRGYDAEDKKTVENMVLNNRVIGGLVTDLLRPNWVSLSAEKMYDAVETEIADLQNAIVASWEAADAAGVVPHNTLPKIDDPKEYIKRQLVDLHFYSDQAAQTNFLDTIDKFIDNKALYHFFIYDKTTRSGRVIPALFKYSSLPETYQDDIKAIYTGLTDTANLCTRQQLRDLVRTICRSSPLAQLDIVHPNTGEILATIYTPEEKLIASDTIKAIIPTLEVYQRWYDKVQRVLSDSKYSVDDLNNILSALEAN